MKTKLEQPIKIGNAQLDRLALLEDTTGGSSSPRGYQKPSRRENMMYSKAKFVEQEAQQQQVTNLAFYLFDLCTERNLAKRERERTYQPRKTLKITTSNPFIPSCN